MNEIAEISLRWARKSRAQFPRWEVNELHNEAFLISVRLVQSGRYKPDMAKLSTFLWHALPLDVRHRYRNANGERYLTCKEDGKRRYRRTQIDDDGIIERATSTWSGSLTMLEPKLKSLVDTEWLEARIAGHTASQLRRRGMSYQEQRSNAERLKHEQRSKGQEG